MTDRELLLSIRAQISEHVLLNPLEPCLPELVITPPIGNFTPPKGNFDGWVWPIPKWSGDLAKISDGFRRHLSENKRQHLGCDIMYRNDIRQDRDLPEVTPWYNLPSDTIPMLAMGPGTIWFAGKTSMGWTVKIDHGDIVGFPLVTYYTHMSELTVPENPAGIGGVPVTAGMQIGVVGNSPKGLDPNHCHVEMWDYSNGGGERVSIALNPERYLRCFGQVVLGP